MLAIQVGSSYTQLHMKYIYVIAIVLTTIVCVICFDAIVVFLLSGFIPGINITLAPSTSIAVMIASTILVGVVVQYRQDVYRLSLSLYDAFFGIKKKNATPAPEAKTKLPRRRYQEL